MPDINLIKFDTNDILALIDGIITNNISVKELNEIKNALNKYDSSKSQLTDKTEKSFCKVIIKDIEDF